MEFCLTVSEHHDFHLPTDPIEIVLWSSDNQKVTRAVFPDDGGELLYATAVTGAYDDELRMTRFGARLCEAGRLLGVAYGFLFRVRRGAEPPDAAVFYDWCDSASSEAAVLARSILDSGASERLFAAGDLLAFDAYEFAAETPATNQCAALRKLAVLLKRRFRGLGTAVITVHPAGSGPPPGTHTGTQSVTAYRRQLDRLLKVARDLGLGTCLKPKAPTEDVLIVRGHSLSHEEEIRELLRRTHGARTDGYTKRP